MEQRPAAAHNARTICANWGYVRLEKTDGRSGRANVATWPHFGRPATLNTATYCAPVSSISAGHHENRQVACTRVTVYGSDDRCRMRCQVEPYRELRDEEASSSARAAHHSTIRRLVRRVVRLPACSCPLHCRIKPYMIKAAPTAPLARRQRPGLSLWRPARRTPGHSHRTR
jgi:hypothetical protein